MKIGIIGAGFVGGAIKNAYDTFGVPVLVLDPAKGFVASWEELRTCDGVYVCVPSPTSETGECDTSILEEVLQNLAGMEGVIISKVTAPPGVYSKLQVIYPNLVHAPEFLVAATANEDYITGYFAFIGGSEEYCQRAEAIIRASQPSLRDVTYCTIAEASLAKYTINSFLATKVVFMNQIYDLAQQLGVNYQAMTNMIQSDKRFGSSHLRVPGPDGSRGFAGACFPKDTQALIFEAERAGLDFSLLKSAVDANKKLRELDK
jgi:UDPglucose 6-dehydrogenase